jgi:DNA-binding response OmpR family regulator
VAWVVLLASDSASEVRDLLPQWPALPYQVRLAALKTLDADELVAVHPDVLLIDATGDLEAAEDVTRKLSLVWEVGLPPIVVILDDAGVGRFRLERGADDFVMSTASAAEITARLAAAASRAGGGEGNAVLKAGDLVVNPDNYQVYVRGRPLDLTYKEFELLKFLAQRPGRVCDRDLLLREVWGYDYYGGTRTVDVHIRRLRAKLGPEHEHLIETIRNVGYRLVPRPRER